MTSRNLNRTWRDVVFAQYATDHDADVPFPVRYLINAAPWHRDIFIEIRGKISVRDFRRAVAHFYIATRFGEPVYRDERIAVWPRRRRGEEEVISIVDDGNDEQEGAGAE